MCPRVLRFYNSLNIASKLKFISIYSAVIAATIISILFITFEYFNEKELSIQESTTFAKVLAVNIVDSIVKENLVGISNTLSSIEHNDKIVQTLALDNSWNIVGSFYKGKKFLNQSKLLSTVKEYKNLWNDGYFYSVVPIVKDTKVYGNLVVVVSLEKFYTKIIRNIIIFLIVLIAVYITVRIRRVLQESILQPIATLNAITTQIIKTKKLDAQFPSFHSDEIGELADNFQNMITDLDTYHDELHRKKESLFRQANYDLLTGLPNRMYFYEQLEQSIGRADRSGENFALFFIDLDQFKEVNDTFGHGYGDKLLQNVASKLTNILRKNDILSRLGGDEFTVIANDLEEHYSASVLAQKILDILALPITVDGEELFISCSIGISLFPQDSTSASKLLKYADIAMYRSKNNGRNRYNFYTKEMTNEVIARVKMQSKLRKALENREFILYYQAQYNMQTQKIVGVESLVRWREKGGKIKLPDTFIPFAEELGMVVAINRQVMHMAMRQAKEWSDKKLYFGRISINISIEQIEDEDFVSFVSTLLKESECKAEWITLELTESHVMSNAQISSKVLTQLSDLGIEIAVDDFGTGHSSLSYLKYLPLNKLKIDRSFIKDIPQDKDSIAIVDAIIAISKSLKLGIIAEGVETKEQKEFLLSRGCYRVQGFLYSHPIPAYKMTRKLLPFS
jgi:diguanylate cyclase (GGDEF)-like protein